MRVAASIPSSASIPLTSTRIAFCTRVQLTSSKTVVPLVFTRRSPTMNLRSGAAAGEIRDGTLDFHPSTAIDVATLAFVIIVVFALIVVTIALFGLHRGAATARIPRR